MDRIETTTGSFGQAAAFDPLAQVRAYWEGLRWEGDIPLRAQINPRGIESALSSTFLIERVAPGIARFRIAGMDLADLMGAEVRGLPMSAIFSATARPALADQLEQVFAGPAVLVLNLVTPSGLGRPPLTARLVVMPLRDDAGQTGLALGCIAMNGEIGRSPRRFDIVRASVTTVAQPNGSRAATNPDSDFAPQTANRTATSVFAEDGQTFAHANSGQNSGSADGPKPKTRLRVVK